MYCTVGEEHSAVWCPRLYAMLTQLWLRCIGDMSCIVHSWLSSDWFGCNLEAVGCRTKPCMMLSHPDRTAIKSATVLSTVNSGL